MRKGIHKRFCQRGHDVFVCGRDKNNRACKDCQQLKNRGLLKDLPILSKSIPEIKPIKICSRCNLEKSIDDFGQDKVRKDGKAVYCRNCQNKLTKDWKQRNQGKVKEMAHGWYLKNKEHVVEYHRRWNKQNPGRHKELSREWCHNNLDRRSHNEAKRRARVRVKWGQDGIVEFYKHCPKDMEVDHIIPLQGKLVSGLHVIWNLQYLKPEENLRKLHRCNLLAASRFYGNILTQV